MLTQQYRQTYNRIRPHNSLGYRPPAPETILSANLVPVLVGLNSKWYNHWGQVKGVFLVQRE